MRAQDFEIPLVNLNRQYAALKVDVLAAISDVLETKEFILGPYVRTFEREFATYHGVEHAIGCSSGTSAISLALEALGIGEGHEVITVGHTFAASAGAIRNAGAIPVFIDIEPGAYGMDPSLIEAAVTSRTRAILPVHIYGTPCDMTAIDEIARARGVVVIEDAAQAHGAEFNGRRIGVFGAAATFSFYPGKNLGAYGDAGAVTTNDTPLAERIRKLRDHGRASKYTHDIVGHNHRMDGIQGAVLSVKLKQLDSWTNRRRAVAARYDAAFRAQGFKTIEADAKAKPVYHLYVVEASNRDEVREALGERGIATGIHYPVPLERQPAFAPWAGPKHLAITERVADRIVSLPICGDITDDEQTRVIDAFLDVARI